MSKVRVLPALVAFLVAFLVAASHAGAQDSARCSPKETLITMAHLASHERPAPFALGERLEYSVKIGIVPVGSGEMRLVGHDTVRGIPVWKATFMTSGGHLGVYVHDTSTSWFDPLTFNSLHFVQHLNEPKYHSNRDNHIFPDRRQFQRNADTAMASVADPMDEVSLVYFFRSLQLEPGQCYVLNRYFKPDGNPIVLHVLRRERGIEVGAGKFNTIVIHPEITTTGIFSKSSHAELWLADDSTHAIVQLTTGLPFGTLKLFLSHIGIAPVSKP